jgi:predicted small lipoprotein YifL
MSSASENTMVAIEKGEDMKKRKWFLTFMLIVVLTIGLAGCGGDSEVTTPPEEATTASQPEPSATTVPPPTAAPTATPESEPTDTAELQPSPEEAELNLDELGPTEELSSYRSRMRLSTTGTGDEGETGGVMDILVEYTREPLAQHVVISGEGLGQTAETGSMEMYQVEDTTYLKLGEQWISTPATDDVLDQTGMIAPEDMLDDTCGWRRAGRSDYNGVAAEHWTLSEEDMKACMAGQAFTELGNITAASGELYIAEENNYIAYMQLVFEGTNLGLGTGSEGETVEEGRLEFTYEMTDVNMPFTIELPEEAVASSELPEDIPVPEDAEELSFMFGMMTFNSASSSAEVAEYYQAQMPQNGWSESSVTEMSGMYMLDYTKDSRKVSLIISTDDDTDMTSVLITLQED